MKYSPGVTVAIPTIPMRRIMLSRAVESAMRQTRHPQAVSIAVDNDHRGAWDTRNRAVAAVRTEWTALLDDDDYFYPHHIEALLGGARDYDADYVYSWPDVKGGINPLDGEFQDWKPGLQTTTTILVRTELAQDVGWHRPADQALVPGTKQPAGEDYEFTLGCADSGAVIHHISGRTWVWVHHGANTSGQPYTHIQVPGSALR